MPPRVSPIFLVAAGVSGLLGLIGGSAFLWAPPGRAWSIFIAAFLWTLISSAGTTLGRYVTERLPRGNWRRGLFVAGVMSFPLTSIYLGVALAASAASAARPPLATVVPVIYTCTLVLALLMGLAWVLTSPFRPPNER